MHTPDLTVELIHALIPADCPEHNQLRYFFNQLLKIRSPDSDESAQVYFPPANWPDCNLNQEQLSELFNEIQQQKKLRAWPVPAYLTSIHLASDPQVSIQWAGLNVHILLALANMQDRQDLIDHLSARFRMAVTNQKHTWLWAQLPPLEPTWQATEKALENIEARMEAEYTRTLEGYQQSLPGSELQTTLNKRAFTDYWKRLFPYPDTAFRRMGEIRLAYITAIQHRPKIQRSLSTQTRCSPFLAN